MDYDDSIDEGDLDASEAVGNTPDPVREAQSEKPESCFACGSANIALVHIRPSGEQWYQCHRCESLFTPDRVPSEPSDIPLDTPTAQIMAHVSGALFEQSVYLAWPLSRSCNGAATMQVLANDLDVGSYLNILDPLRYFQSADDAIERADDSAVCIPTLAGYVLAATGTLLEFVNHAPHHGAIVFKRSK